jgi:hypothetical protein
MLFYYCFANSDAAGVGENLIADNKLAQPVSAVILNMIKRVNNNFGKYQQLRALCRTTLRQMRISQRSGGHEKSRQVANNTAGFDDAWSRGGRWRQFFTVSSRKKRPSGFW